MEGTNAFIVSSRFFQTNVRTYKVDDINLLLNLGNRVHCSLYSIPQFKSQTKPKRFLWWHKNGILSYVFVDPIVLYRTAMGCYNVEASNEAEIIGTLKIHILGGKGENFCSFVCN